jgi:copper homeostasis protein
VEKAAERISIMPGSGIRSSNLHGIARNTGAQEFHSSAGTLQESRMQFIRPEFARENSYQLPDKQEVSAMRSILQNLSA